MPVLVWLLPASRRARPKSATLTSWPAVSSTFSGLTSRCASPAVCAAPRPPSTPSMMSRASRGRRLPRSFSRSRSVRPGTYSMARYSVRPSAPWSYTPTTLGCESRATERASPTNRRTKSSSLASSACMIFSATVRSSRVSVPRYTVAIPPVAIRDSTRYRPSRSPADGWARERRVHRHRLYGRSSLRALGTPVRCQAVTGSDACAGTGPVTCGFLRRCRGHLVAGAAGNGMPPGYGPGGKARRARPETGPPRPLRGPPGRGQPGSP